MIDTIITKVRYLIEDFGTEQIDSFEYTTSLVFILTNHTDVTINTVTVNGTDIDDISAVDYSYNSTTGKMTFTGLTVNDIIEINYTYNKYSDSELTKYIRASLNFININSYNSFKIDTKESGESGVESGFGETIIFPTPTLREKSLIAIIASVIIKPNFSVYGLPTLTVRYPETMSKEEKIEKLISRFYRDDGSFDLFEIEDYDE